MRPVFFLVVLSGLLACQPESNNELSQQDKHDLERFGIDYPDKLILMHNPMGVRIEYNISEQKFEPMDITKSR